jgi:hypothetical protein
LTLARDGKLGYSRCMNWIFEQPKLAHLVGRGLSSFGGFLIVCGLIGHAGMLAINQTRSIGKLAPLNGLADAYPMYPLWWVPEGLVGYAVAVVIACAGLYLALTAKTLLKAMNAGSGRRRY